MEFDIDSCTVFLGLTGSHAYGTAREGSDVDIRGCCIAPMEVRLSFRTQFEQLTWMAEEPGALERLGARFALACSAASRHPSAGRPFADAALPTDLVVFDLIKVVRLCVANNPNMLEMLFLDQQELLYTSSAWDQLRRRRHSFLSQRVRHTFAGYARSQLRRIQGHREWLLNPPSHPPARAEFELPDHAPLSADDRNRIEEAIAKVIRGWSVDEGIELPSAQRDVLRERLRSFWSAALSAGAQQAELDHQMADVAGAHLGLDTQVLRTLQRERKYQGARKRWQQFTRWKGERNTARAALEANHGYDTKHAMHLIRLLRMGVEILRDGELRVRRPDAAELLEIRDGALSYAELLVQADALDAEMRDAAASSALPSTPDEAELDALATDLVRAHS